MDGQLVALAAIEQLKYYFPLPWHIEQDWTVEVTTVSGKVAVKCMNIEEAGAIIGLASGQLPHPSVKDWLSLAKRLLQHQLVEHPVPWRIASSGSDWEVLASDELRMLKVASKDLAEQVVEFTVEHEADMLIFEAELELEAEVDDQKPGPIQGFRSWWQKRLRQDPDYDPGT